MARARQSTARRSRKTVIQVPIGYELLASIDAGEKLVPDGDLYDGLPGSPGRGLPRSRHAVPPFIDNLLHTVIDNDIHMVLTAGALPERSLDGPRSRRAVVPSRACVRRACWW